MSTDDIFSIADIIDSQLESSDKQDVGRVADIEAEWREDGTLVLCNLVTGPQALAGRVARPLRSLAQRLLHDHFEHTIPLSDVEKFGRPCTCAGRPRTIQWGVPSAGLPDIFCAGYQEAGIDESEKSFSGRSSGLQDYHSGGQDAWAYT
jgi:hypothetical protein